MLSKRYSPVRIGRCGNDHPLSCAICVALTALSTALRATPDKWTLGVDRRLATNVPRITSTLRCVTDKVSVDLSGAAQTMLATLYLKALDADFDRPVLGDRFAKEAVEPPRLRLARARHHREVGAADHGAHRPVRHLGAPVPGRPPAVHRRPPRVRSGQPGVPAGSRARRAVVRRRLSGRYRVAREDLSDPRPDTTCVATSATDPSWLDQIPADRPVLLLAEGISMYLTEHEGVALLRRVVDRFPSGELQIDFYNWLAIKSQKTQTLMRRTGSTLYWAVNEPAGHPGAGFGTPVADRGDVLRREHVQPGVDGLPVGETSGPCRPAAAPDAAIPPLRVRARDVPVATCGIPLAVRVAACPPRAVPTNFRHLSSDGASRRRVRPMRSRAGCNGCMADRR